MENGERIFVRLHLRARGAVSGVEWSQPAFHVWTMRDGLGIRLVATFDEAEARREAGLVHNAAP